MMAIQNHVTNDDLVDGSRRGCYVQPFLVVYIEDGLNMFEWFFEYV